MNYRLFMPTPLLSLSILVFSCSGHIPPSISPLEDALGPGWTCYIVPDTFKTAGNVIERTSNGRTVHYMDFSDRSESGESQIGAVFWRKEWTFSAIARLLQLSERHQEESTVNAAADVGTIVDVAYGDTRKHTIDGDDLDHILTKLERKPGRLTPGSRYFVFRESHSATSAKIRVERSAVARLTRVGVPADTGTLLPRGSHEGEARYLMDAEFQGRLGICTIATELHIERGFDGGVTIQLGSDLPLPEGLTIMRGRP